MINSGALPKLALKKPPTPGPGVLGHVLRRLADQPCERHQRDRREHERRRLADVEDVLGDEGERVRGRAVPRGSSGSRG